MLHFADLSQTGYGHLIFNSAFIQALSLATGEREIEVSAEAHLCGKIRNQLPDLKVNSRPHRWQLRGGRIKNFVFRDLLSFPRIVRLFWRARTQRASYLVVLSMSPIAHIFFRAVNLCFRKQKVLVIYHGELESYRGRSCNLMQSDFWFPASSRIPIARHTRYLVLGESIYNNLRGVGFPYFHHINWIHHPYLWDATERRPNLANKKLVFGCIGSVSRYPKNSQVFFELARDLQEFVINGDVEFRVVGKVDESLAEFVDAPVVLPKESSVLSQNYFREALSEIDVSIFTFGRANYRLTASGSFLDGIHMKIPFLALANDFIGHYAQASRELGIVCEDYTEMKATVLKLIRDRAQIPSGTNEFDKLKRVFSPEAVSQQLRQIIDSSL